MAGVNLTMQEQVAQLYVSLFGRAPDVAGAGYWASQLAAGQTVAQVAQAILTNPAVAAVYSPFLTNSELVTNCTLMY